MRRREGIHNVGPNKLCEACVLSNARIFP